MNENTVRVGTDLIRQLSETFYPNTKSIFREMIVNGRDAGASNISINLGNTQVIIEDDGQGMDREGLIKYFYISHSTKKENPYINVKGINRRIIGKYGIGKLSMHQLGGKILIETWRGGDSYRATFDFDEMLKNKFIDEITLNVEGPVPNFKNASGTKITILKLKKHINALMLKRALQKTMPLKPDFKIKVNNQVLRSYKLDGEHYQIAEDHPVLGRIDGRIIFTEEALSTEEAGVHIRVHGVSVNENPRIMNFVKLSSSMGRYNKFYMDVNVDKLDEVMLSNRAGFVEDSDLYKEFLIWCEKLLRKHFGIEYRRKKDERAEVEKMVLPKVIAGMLKEKFKHLEEAQALMGFWTKTGDSIGTKLLESQKKPTDGIGTKPSNNNKPTGEKPKHQEKKLTDKTDESTGSKRFTVKGVRFSVELEDLGSNGVECEFNDEKKAIIINQSHPLYLESRKLDNLEYHCLKSATVCMSIVFSKSLQDFQEIYNELCQEKKEMK